MRRDIGKTVSDELEKFLISRLAAPLAGRFLAVTHAAQSRTTPRKRGR
jgi:hypothetical protein